MNSEKRSKWPEIQFGELNEQEQAISLPVEERSSERKTWQNKSDALILWCLKLGLFVEVTTSAQAKMKEEEKVRKAKQSNCGIMKGALMGFRATLTLLFATYIAYCLHGAWRDKSVCPPLSLPSTGRRPIWYNTHGLALPLCLLCPKKNGVTFLITSFAENALSPLGSKLPTGHRTSLLLHTVKSYQANPHKGSFSKAVSPVVEWVTQSNAGTQPLELPEPTKPSPH